ncbi:aldehyde dehydrogenase [Streptomyces fuscichromogenes]|uniref:Aldehyde dehydrogenase n=1 Tax=Streptomyces fuscichromogenes TaxID=1324013 RepID=A0A918CSZ9_9ACTN|nr:aldehyde dehydrogenase [Streptomyces fuscichromogenes]GGN19331.1 aldehyde dehydrogenase [Streptomyces fuscichromogenes]
MDTYRDISSLYIDGEQQRPLSTETYTVVSPSTEEEIGHIPVAGAKDVDTAVAAARRALDAPGAPWATSTPAERADAMERFADAIEARADELSRLVSRQNGMPIAMSPMVNAYGPAALLRYYAGLARTLEWEERRPAFTGATTVVRREPVGVVAAIVPWNYPQMLAMTKIGPALAAGCTIVLKPALETSLDAYVLAEAAAEAGLPPGVLNILPGGLEAGEALVSHPGVDKVAFTGSTPAGRAIGEVCGRLLRPVTLELGGKSAAIILDDADLAATIAGLPETSLANNGQTCYLSTRILAPASRYDEILDAISTLASSLTVGDPLDPATAVGPLVTARQRERVEGYIASARSEGARLTAGGGRPTHTERGWYVEPTIFADVRPEMTIAREEIFGPVLTVTPYGTDDEAVILANDSEFGLGGSVWTSDDERGMAIARRVRTGTIGLNGYNFDFSAPYGGRGASGLGREYGPEGLNAYLEWKSVYLQA